MADYKTVRSASSGELTEKRSRFIGYCKPVSTEEEATAFIASIRSRHWDARHNVYAYSQAARLGLEAAQVVLMERCACCTLRCSYTHYGKIASLLQEHGAGLDDTVYEADVLLRFHIKPEALPGLNKALADATAGEIAVETEKEAYFPKPEKI